MSSLNMLPEQSFRRPSLSGLDGVSSGPPFSGPPAFSGDFLGLPLHDEDSFWGLSPMSPSLPTWNAKDQAFDNPGLERDLKNTHVRNGQPTPPPYDDAKQSQDIYSLAHYQLEGTPPIDLDSSQHQLGSDSTGNSNDSSKRRKVTRRRSPMVEHDGGQRQEKAKREKFLERNRLAASKCRQKKKEHTMLLETRYKEQSDKKEKLMSEIARLRSDLLGLKNEVLKHAQCGDEPIKLHLAQMVKKITYNDAGSEVTDTADAASPSSEAATTPVAQAPPSFGFDDQLQLEPQPAAAAGPMEQARRDSEASLMTDGGSYGFEDDGFDELINV